MPNTLTFGNPESIAETRASDHAQKQMREMHYRFGVKKAQTCLGCKHLTASFGLNGLRNTCGKYNEHHRMGTRWKPWYMACGAYEAAKTLVWK